MTSQATFSTAKARVESGDFSFDAMAAMCNAHAATLIERKPVELTSTAVLDYLDRYYADVEGRLDDPRYSFSEPPADFGCPSMRVQATYTDDRGVPCIAIWDVWVECGQIYGEC